MMTEMIWCGAEVTHVHRIDMIGDVEAIFEAE